MFGQKRLKKWWIYTPFLYIPMLLLYAYQSTGKDWLITLTLFILTVGMIVVSTLEMKPKEKNNK